MVRKRRKAASPEFRREVLRMVARGDKSIPEIEQDLELTKGIVYRWVESYGAHWTGRKQISQGVDIRSTCKKLRQRFVA